MKKIAIFILFLTIVFSVPSLAKRATRGFRLGKLSLDLYFNPAWEVAPPDKETLDRVHSMLKLPFRYLSHGAQSFVFESEDGQYIVKLFRYDQKAHPWREWLRNRVLAKKKKFRQDEKIHHLFTACKLAYEKASDLTGLVYVHLNKTEDTLPVATFIDCLHRSYHLDLNRYRFAIQHRGRPIREVLLESIASGDTERTHRLLASFTHLLEQRTARGIRNSDTKVAPNFGFWNDTAIEWDFGNYSMDEQLSDPNRQQMEQEMFAIQIRRFLSRIAPEFIPIEL